MKKLNDLILWRVWSKKLNQAAEPGLLAGLLAGWPPEWPPGGHFYLGFDNFWPPDVQGPFWEPLRRENSTIWPVSMRKLDDLAREHEKTR